MTVQVALNQVQKVNVLTQIVADKIQETEQPVKYAFGSLTNSAGTVGRSGFDKG